MTERFHGFLRTIRRRFETHSRRRRPRDVRRAWRAEQLEDRRLLALTPFDLGQLLVANGGDGSDGVVFQAGGSGDAVSNLGDVSGDGIADFVVSAPGGAIPTDGGNTFVVFGTGSPFPAEFDLTTLDGTNGFVLSGTDVGERSGAALAAAGDVNYDGIQDIIVGAPESPVNNNDAGRSYVVFGRDVSVNPFPADFQLSGLLTANGGNGSAGFAINGEAASDLSGSSVAGLGDVTGDNIDDLIVGVAGSDVAGNGSGSSYVIFGRNAAVTPFPAEIELSSLLAANGGDGSAGFAVHGAAAGDLSGISVSSAGDFNNDTINDILIGASDANSPGGFNQKPGEAYVLFGRDIGANPFAAEIGLGDLFAGNGGNGTVGFVMLGITGFFGGGDHLGRAVAPAGDLNNDGIDDILVGAPDANNAPPGSNGAKGEAYVIFGRSDVAGTLGAEFPLANLLPANGGDGSDGVVFPGVDFADRSGSTLALVGDVNNDALDDILIGAPGGTPHGDRSGEAYLVFGSANPFPAVFDVTALDGTNGLIFHGFERNDDLTGVPISVFGVAEATAISGGGDINNDGVADLIIGAPGRDETFVVFGGALDGNGIVERVPSSFELSDLQAANGGDGSQGAVFNGFANIGNPGFSVSTAGDVNNDMIADFLIGAPGQGSGGTVFVVFGTAAGFPAEVALDTLDGTNGFTITGLTFVDSGGAAVGAAGDVNGDGIGDIVIGAPGADADGAGTGGPFDEHGQTYVFFGRDTAFPATVTFEELLTDNGGNGTLGFVINGMDADDRSGTSVSAGDVNNDGFADIIIGAPNAENVFAGVGNTNNDNRGETYVIFGRDASSTPFAAELELSSLLPANGGDGSNGVIINGAVGGTFTGHRSGTSVHGAGDYNNDGFDDVIVGAPPADGNRGDAFLVLGASSLGPVVELSSLLTANGGDGSAGTVFHGFTTYFAGGGRVGSVVNGAGDFNNDGFDDLIIEAPGENINANNDAKGDTYVIFGRSDANTLGAEFGLENLYAANGGDGSNGFVLQGINFADGAGISPAHSAGDFNGDGIDDIITARYAATPHGNGTGQSYLVFGSENQFPAQIDLATLDGNNGLAFNGINVGEQSGASISGAGDVNNDGFDDLIIGAPGARPAEFAAGRAYVVFGGPFGCSTTVTNTNDSGDGSLRSAIECSNFLPTLDTIDFDIPGPGPHVITLLSDLPAVTDRTIIDGTTEPDFAGTPVVELSNLAANLALELAVGGTVRGLSISGFPTGVLLSGGSGHTVDGNLFTEDEIAIEAQSASDVTIRNNTTNRDESTGISATAIALIDVTGTNVIRDNSINFTAALGDNPFVEAVGISVVSPGSFTLTNNDVTIPAGVDGTGFRFGGGASIHFGAGNSASGGLTGLSLTEATTDIADNSLNDFQLLDQTGNFIELVFGFMGGEVIDATNVVFGDSTLNPPDRAINFDAAQRQYLEDKLSHFPDSSSEALIVTVPADFGDAPDPNYPTLRASLGASHLLGSGLFLGAGVDGEIDGQSTAAADGDDLAVGSPVVGAPVGGDDEDGVVFTSALAPGTMASIEVTASQAGGTLSAWIDFDGNGDWSDVGEDIFPGGMALAANVNNLTFPVPAGATLGMTYARFRLTSDGAVTFTGEASDGEVEDYQVNIVAAINADTTVDLVGGVLTITDTGSVSDDDLTISYAGGMYTISDSVLVIDATAVGGGAGTSVTFSDVGVNSIQFDTLDGNDTLTVDFSGDNPVPAGGLSYNGGGQTGAPGDALIIQGTFGTQMLNYTGVGGDGNNGSVDLDGSVITYTGLEPITAGNSADTILNLPTGLANDATLQDSANAGEIEIIDNGATFEDTIIPKPTNSLTVNLGDQGDMLTVNSLDIAYAASLIVNGGVAASDNVQLVDVDLIDTPGRGLEVNEVETLGITGGTISGNTAPRGGGVLITNSTSGTATTATFDGVTIEDNTATGNAATDGGGGIYNDGANVTIQNNSLVSGNVTNGAMGSGGGVLSVGGTLNVTDAAVSGNDLFGLRIINGSGSITGNTFSGNVGADLAIDGTANSDTITIDPSSVVFGGNTVLYDGTVGTLAVFGLDLADGFDVTPSPDTAIHVDGGAPMMAPGDSLAYNGIGTLAFNNPLDPRDGTISAAGVMDVTFADIEAATIACSTTVTNTNNSGDGSLRSAIQCANAAAGADTISFDIPGAGPHVIAPGTPLPAITETAFVDGTTQPGFVDTPIVVLDGFDLQAASHHGLQFNSRADDSSVTGLAIINVPGIAVFISRADGVTVQGNYIGVEPDGVTAAGNGFGVKIINGAGNTIGNTAQDADGNVISGNRVGVEILGPLATGNTVADNVIGTARDGLIAVGNSETGVRILGAPGNIVGGVNAFAANLISGNEIGIEIAGTAAAGNMIWANGIGTDINGGFNGDTIPNDEGIVLRSGAHDNIIGAADQDKRNVISGNRKNGITIHRAPGNIVMGNRIGLPITGAALVGNRRNGIEIRDAVDNVIGGSAAGEGNLISDNNKAGVLIRGTDASGNRLEGNIIGADQPGGVTRGNRIGVVINNSADNIIGGTENGTGNQIVGHATVGVKLTKPGATGNLVQGNSIGAFFGSVEVNPNGEGIQITGRAANNTIGGTAAGAANEIRHNTGRGVWITANAGTGNAVQQNMIRDNGGLGIDLAGRGALPNDTGDADAGANNLQNFPTIESVELNGTDLDVRFLVDSTDTNSAYDLMVEFFIADSDNEEGATFLASVPYAAVDAGNVVMVTIPAGAASVGSTIVATATDSADNTSEFSAAATVEMQPLGQIASFEDLDDTDAADDLMYGLLSAGEHRTSLAALLADANFADF